MSKAAIKHSAALEVASDALDAIAHGQHLSNWLAAVLRSIQLDAEHNASRNIQTLASLGQYLGDDCANFLTSEGQRLRRDLDTVEG